MHTDPASLEENHHSDSATDNKPTPRRSTLLDGHRMNQNPPAPGGDFKVVFVGAGGINFGSREGPWNHSFRLEHKLGLRLKAIALIDPLPATRKKILDEKRGNFTFSAYKDTQEFDNIHQLLEAISKGKLEKPDAFIIGVPPQFHGGIDSSCDLELQIAKALPGVNMFIEKPISNASISQVWSLALELEKKAGYISVGYMLRYLQVVQKAKDIIKKNNLKVVSTSGMYSSCYNFCSKPFWWSKKMTGGPIVEQGTHFLDLSRYFGGDVDLDSVQAVCLNGDEPLAKLGHIPIDESKIEPSDRIPRVTSAIWKYKSGAVGSLVHNCVLLGDQFETALVVHCDGWQFRIVDAYVNPMLYVRTPLEMHEQMYTFPKDDPYFGEIECFVDRVCELAGDDEILSPFTDAAKTYELSRVIADRAEKFSRNSSKAS